MVQLNIGDIRVGYKFLAKDDDDGKWYLSEIVEVFSDRFIARDISDSDWDGIEWEILNDEITDTTRYRTCKKIN